ncbi:MAG: hypothetical protein E7321_02880 [Clostridiales bacterium]|nr:hypothetical protein [Clostridiales bacterium]
MEDFPILFLFLIIYLVAASSGKKKSKRKNTMRSRSQGEQADVRARRRDRQTQEGFDAAFAEKSVTRPAQDACDPRQMHLHKVTQTQMHEAHEGEDPCHVGGIQAQTPVEAGAVWDDEAQMQLRQDVLRGVIMSEILMRPDERRALQRKRYHGQ